MDNEERKEKIRDSNPEETPVVGSKMVTPSEARQQQQRTRRIQVTFCNYTILDENTRIRELHIKAVKVRDGDM